MIRIGGGDVKIKERSVSSPEEELVFNQNSWRTRVFVSK